MQYKQDVRAIPNVRKIVFFILNVMLPLPFSIFTIVKDIFIFNNFIRNIGILSGGR